VCTRSKNASEARNNPHDHQITKRVWYIARFLVGALNLSDGGVEGVYDRAHANEVPGRITWNHSARPRYN
jgi:hypothetical protein